MWGWSKKKKRQKPLNKEVERYKAKAKNLHEVDVKLLDENNRGYSLTCSRSVRLRNKRIRRARSKTTYERR